MVVAEEVKGAAKEAMEEEDIAVAKGNTVVVVEDEAVTDDHRFVY